MKSLAWKWINWQSLKHQLSVWIVDKNSQKIWLLNSPACAKYEWFFLKSDIWKYFSDMKFLEQDQLTMIGDSINIVIINLLCFYVDNLSTDSNLRLFERLKKQIITIDIRRYTHDSKVARWWSRLQNITQVMAKLEPFFISYS